MRLISESRREEPPPEKILYNGKLACVPSTLSGISQLSVSTLRAILDFHGFSMVGSKEELALRVHLLRQGRSAGMFIQQENQLRDFIAIVQQLVIEEQRIHAASPYLHMNRQQSFATSSFSSTLVELPRHVSKLDLKQLFNPQLRHLDAVRQHRVENDAKSTVQLKTYTVKPDLREFVCTPGTSIKIKWSAEEVGDSGWKPGWYKAIVQRYHSGSDILTVVYPCEPGCTYSVDVSVWLSLGKLRSC